MAQTAVPMPVTDNGGVGGSGGYMYAHPQDPSAMMRAGGQRPYPPFAPGTTTLPSSVSSSVTGKDQSGYPQRPGQQECNYFLKTGDCKFGMTCRFHHPTDATHVSSPNSMLNPIGLPLRPVRGEGGGDGTAYVHVWCVCTCTNLCLWRIRGTQFSC